MEDTTHFTLIDAHAHLQDPKIRADLENVLTQARKQHVAEILVNATQPQDWKLVASISAADPNCYAAVGLHPFHASLWTTQLEGQLRRFILNPPEKARIVAVGEIGLDAWNGRDTMARQKEALAAQITLAGELDLPVAIHIRKAWNDFFQIIRELKIRHLRGMCHNFTGSPEVLRKVLELGLMVSFAGPAANPAARKIRQTIGETPPESMLTETDCPNMPLHRDTAEVSLPQDTGEILAAIAQIKKMPEEKLARQIRQNFLRLIRRTCPPLQDRQLP